MDGSFLLAAAYAGCEAWLVGMFFIISVGAQGMIPSSTLVVPMDLSPNFAGPLAALTNGVASTTGFIVPFVIGQLTPNVSLCRVGRFFIILPHFLSLSLPFSPFQSLQSEWRVVFWTTFCFHILKVTSFLTFGSAEVQPWNAPNHKAANADATAPTNDADNKSVAVIPVELPRE